MAALTATACRGLAGLSLRSDLVAPSFSSPFSLASASSEFRGHKAMEGLQRRDMQSHGVPGGNLLVLAARQAPRREKRQKRHMRIRKRLTGTPERPRLAVFRSNQHIYAQVIDDTRMHTLVSGSTALPAMREELKLTAGATIAAARRVGEFVAQQCLDQGITKVAFDRGGFIYHGRVEALADGARSAGLDF